jgi:hypothetical protein
MAAAFNCSNNNLAVRCTCLGKQEMASLYQEMAAIG